MKIVLPIFPVRKTIYSLFIACFSAILVSFASVFAFSTTGFIILFIVYIFLIWKVENKDYIYYHFIRTLRGLFFFLPISAIFYSIALTSRMVANSSDSLSAGATAVGGAIGSFMVIFLCLVIGLVGGLIIGSFAKKPEKEDSNARSIGILFLIILGMSIYYVNQPSIVDKALQGNITDTRKTPPTPVVAVTQTGEVKKVDVITEKSLNDLIGFKIASYKLTEGDYSKDFEFGLEIENKSGRDILGYKGSFEVFDMFDDSLGSFNLEKVGDFNSGALLKEKGSYTYNPYMDANVKLGKAKYEDLKYKYTIKDIIYKDTYNSQDKLFGNNSGKDIDKLDYKITNKTSKKGDFSNSVEFTVDIKNNSGRNIKGIKGGFNVFDIFGEKLGGFEINSTKGILSGATITEKLPYSVNPYISSESKIYEANPDLLKYNFTIENVVYSE